MSKEFNIPTVVCTEYRPCAGCGRMTALWHVKYRFYICGDCNADKTMDAIADHALTGD